jgi:hypothetical protein
MALISLLLKYKKKKRKNSYIKSRFSVKFKEIKSNRAKFALSNPVFPGFMDMGMGWVTRFFRVFGYGYGLGNPVFSGIWIWVWVGLPGFYGYLGMGMGWVPSFFGFYGYGYGLDTRKPNQIQYP